METKELLVVIPHSGVLIPPDIHIDSLSNKYQRLARNIDWYTNWLYDFRDLLGNKCLTFPYSSIILEANRDPSDLDSSVPIKDTFGEPIYRLNHEPDRKLRQLLSRKYLKKFHENIKREIDSGITFMLDAHSTVTAKGVTDNQIELMNFQVSRNNQMIRFCPDIFIETYAEELAKRLPNIKISINESKYCNLYGHVCGEHAIEAMTRVGTQIPAILQETNQNLYMNSDRTPNLEAMETLRRIFAEALSVMIKAVHSITT